MWKQALNTMNKPHHSHLRTSPREIKHGIPLILINGDLQSQFRPVIEPVHRFEGFASKLPIDVLEQVPHGPLGGEHDGVHVVLDDFEGLFFHEGLDQNDTAVACCDLGVEVGEVLRGLGSSANP